MTDRARIMLDWIQGEGAVLETDPRQMARLQDALVRVLALLPDLLPDVVARGLVFFYVYRQRDQENDLQDADGICWYHTLSDGEVLFAVGISVEALRQGERYATLVILHELSHVLRDTGHDMVFHDVLNDLICRYWLAGGGVRSK